jgi:phage repressor protein C with HTH and peptisase S24 domain
MSFNLLPEIEPYETHTITIPLYNSEASAEIGHLQLSSEYVIDHLQVPFARETDIARTIVGDSMTAAMQSGDIAVVRNMPNWNDYLEFENIFIVVSEHEVYCKVISKSEEKEIFRLKSYNSNYSEFEIPKKFIRQVYKVIGIISQRSY